MPNTIIALPPSQAQLAIQNLADVLLIPPSSFGSNYLSMCIQAASLVGKPSPEAEQALRSNPSVQPPQVQQAPNSPWGGITTSSTTSTANAALVVRNAALLARNNVLARIQDVVQFVSRAKNAGFAPPDNPYVVVAQYNVGRTFGALVYTSPELAADLTFNMGVFSQLLDAERAGTITLSGRLPVQPQIVHTTVGAPRNDLQQFLPDADSIIEAEADATAARLDFGRRRVKVMFSLDYEPDGIPKGSIVGWRKLADASGYIVERTNIFTQQVKTYTLPNQDITAKYALVANYVRQWALSFYDDVDPSRILAFNDDMIDPDGYYQYVVKAYQIQNTSGGTIFSVPTNRANMSPTARANVQRRLQETAAAAGRSADDISPWPIIAQQLVGDQALDWVLAGVNVKSSILRGEDRSLVRTYSYVGAHLSDIFARMDAGNFFVPAVTNSVSARIAASVATYGVIQTIAEILRDTGTTFYFDEKDSTSHDFNRAGTVQVGDGVLGIILAAIDPETATLDVGSLVSHFGANPSGNSIQQATLAIGSPALSRPTELELTAPEDTTDTSFARDELQSLAQSTTQANLLDLTTFDGLGQMVRTVRLLVDQGVQIAAPRVTSQNTSSGANARTT